MVYVCTGGYYTFPMYGNNTWVNLNHTNETDGTSTCILIHGHVVIIIRVRNVMYVTA